MIAGVALRANSNRERSLSVRGTKERDIGRQELVWSRPLRDSQVTPDKPGCQVGEYAEDNDIILEPGNELQVL